MKILILVVTILLLTLIIPVACEQPEETLPRWLTLEHRQQANFQEHITPSD